MKIEAVGEQVHAYISQGFQHQKNGNIAKIQKSGTHNHDVHGDNAQVGQEKCEALVDFIDADGPAFAEELHQFSNKDNEERNFQQHEVDATAITHHQENKVHQVEGAVVNREKKGAASLAHRLSGVLVGDGAGGLFGWRGQQLQEGKKADHDALQPINQQQGFETVVMLVIIPDKIEVEAYKQQQRVIGGEFSDH